MSSPSFVVPLKNSTEATPCGSDALATIPTVAGAVNGAPAAGEVMLTLGPVLALTVTVRTALVVCAPAVSVARAVIE